MMAPAGWWSTEDAVDESLATLHAARAERIMTARDEAREKYRRLQRAVRELYNAAYWHADRPCDAERLWTEVRDAGGLV